jgi:hypothetical protein
MLKLNMNCPSCGGIPLNNGPTRIYMDSKEKVFKIKCTHCKVMLDLLMTPEQFEDFKSELGNSLTPISFVN